MATWTSILSIGRGEVKIQLPRVQIIFAVKFRISVSSTGARLRASILGTHF